MVLGRLTDLGDQTRSARLQVVELNNNSAYPTIENKGLAGIRTRSTVRQLCILGDAGHPANKKDRAPIPPTTHNLNGKYSPEASERGPNKGLIPQ